MGFFAVKLGCSQRYGTGKRFSASFQRVMLIFISFCSKQRFDLFSAKLRYFQHYVSENRLFLVFVRKLYFRPLILSKTCFGVLAMKSKVSGILLQKNSDFVFRCLIPFFGPQVAKIRFYLLATKLLCFELYITKKSVFAFSLLKHVALGFIAQITCFGLFAVILGYWTKKRSSSSMQLVTLILT